MNYTGKCPDCGAPIEMATYETDDGDTVGGAAGETHSCPKPLTHSLYVAALEFQGRAITPDSVKTYVGVLIAEGTVAQRRDGEIVGKMFDGTCVHLGHILDDRKKDWIRLGHYLMNFPLPEHW